MNTELKDLAIKQAAICSVFASHKRILILWALSGGESSVGEIAASIGSSLQNTSQHLSLMRNKNLVQTRREAQTIYYSIAEDETTLCPFLLEAGCRTRQLV